MRSILILLSAITFTFAASLTLTSCGRNDNNANDQAKEKVLENNARTDTVTQDHTAVADTTDKAHSGGMNVGGK